MWVMRGHLAIRTVRWAPTPSATVTSGVVLTRCSATVASYRSLSSALEGWDAVTEANAAREVRLIDAALVEHDVDTIRRIHRHQPGPAGGSVATALLGLLEPTAIITGAVAGGVGGRVLVALHAGFGRDDLGALGEALDAGPFALVGVFASDESPEWARMPLGWSALVSVASTVTASELDRAVELDQLDDAMPDDPDDLPSRPSPNHPDRTEPR